MPPTTPLFLKCSVFLRRSCKRAPASRGRLLCTPGRTLRERTAGVRAAAGRPSSQPCDLVNVQSRPAPDSSVSLDTDAASYHGLIARKASQSPTELMCSTELSMYSDGHCRPAKGNACGYQHHTAKHTYSMHSPMVCSVSKSGPVLSEAQRRVNVCECL